MGDHDEDHGGHEHGSDEEKSKLMKSLVAVLGIYIFFLFESGMSMIRKRRKEKKVINRNCNKFNWVQDTRKVKPDVHVGKMFWLMVNFVIDIFQYW